MPTTPATPVDRLALRRQLNEQILTDHDDEHEHERALARTQLVFDLLYDDEKTEPGLAIRDALTDLLHMTNERGIDFEQVIIESLRACAEEREAWGLDA